MVNITHDDSFILERNKYWDGYYSKSNPTSIPTQFAVFVLNECPHAKVIIDIGCGSGRDSMFFSRQGLFCLGIDGSESAIQACKIASKANNLLNVEFIKADLNNVNLFDEIDTILNKIQIQGSIIIYARFLLHAITDEEELAFIKLANLILNNRSGYIALEFRTERDKQQTKATENHYRRYVDPVHFFSRIQKNGFEVDYFVEGFGFAKYKADDAHVARFILKKVMREE